MDTHDEVDELTLNAYVDGQLDPELERSVLRAMDSSPQIRDQVYRLRRAKDWMHCGFADARPTQQPLPDKRRFIQRFAAGIAASFVILAVSVGGGVLGYNLADSNSLPGGVLQADESHVVLHLDESDPAKFTALLDYAEHFLIENRDPGARVEVIANAGGVDLMRVGISPVEERIRRLSRQYHNLQFIACANAVRNLRLAGEEPLFIGNVHTGVTAVDHIVDRIRDGWTYKRLDDLPGI